MSEQGRKVAIGPGDRLRVRDFGGEWRDKIAVSAVEGCYVDGKLTHDFAGVYVRRPDGSLDDDGVFWPLEDIEVAE